MSFLPLHNIEVQSYITTLIELSPASLSEFCIQFKMSS